MRSNSFIWLLILVLLLARCSSHRTKDGFKLNDEKVIVTKTPSRPRGQSDVLGLTVPAIDTVRVGFVGLGMRGSDAVVRYTYVPGVKITAICDVEPDRVEASQKDLAQRGFPAADGYSGTTESYMQLCEDPDVDLVYICTDWEHHVPVALYAMEHGKHVAIEVPSAYSLEDCWALVDMAEKTRLHCMILENCCYDFFELSALQMAREGLFGEVIHAEGSYLHNLDPYWDEYWHSWRLTFNKEHRGDAYPTHGFGPVCQALNIHRGDRLKTLVAMDTKAFNGPRHVEARGGENPEEFKNGDVSTTMIRTEKGKTILIEHDVMTPRPYSRMYQLVGTEGYAAKYPVNQLCFRNEALDGRTPDYSRLEGEKTLSGEELSEFMEQHRSPILTPELEALAKEVGGHGGMDFIMDYRLIYCLRNGLPLDMDVYDLAEWCCVSELSAISMEHGGAPVEVPDFTRGAWDRIDGFSYAFAK
ncbi:MAG: Gfo/Idh/MocA family oxidoreductase [Bacteroidales bacterium]|nr:Gfo/Idh/MocA family oxidoreductase [Bacteroidales bacterium]